MQVTAGVDRRIYLTAAVLSLLLSAWAVWAQFVPNPDAALYLRSAEQFADGQWTAGIGTFRWPFYSLLIAATMTVTGLKALVARHTGDAGWNNVRPPHLRLSAKTAAKLFAVFDACGLKLAAAA